jgi:integrase
MGKGIHRLTDRTVVSAKPQPCQDKGSPNYGNPICTVYADGGGLYLKVTAAGTKSWIYRWYDGKPRVMGLGAYPVVTLAKARERALEQARVKEAGGDPIEARAQKIAEHRATAALEKAKAAGRKTFGDVAEEYITAKEAGWRGQREGQDWRTMFKLHAAELLPLPVAEIDVQMVLRVIEPIWSTRYKLAKKLQSRIAAVLAAATVRGYRQGDNPAAWREHLQHAGLAAPDAVMEVQPHKAMPFADVPTFIAELHAIDHEAARATEFLILTASRAGEVAQTERSPGMKWSEIDFEAATWTIPAERMKGRVKHRVPLSNRAVAILRDVARTDERVFRKIGYAGIKKRFEKLCPDVDVHGFRSSFRDWCSVNRIDHDVAEKSLAHYTGSKTEKAYNRDDLLELRRPVMEAWARFCCGLDASDNVVPMHAAG